MFIAAAFANSKPMILLNHEWNDRVGKLYYFFTFAQLICFFLVLFVDAFKFIFIAAGMGFRGGAPTEDENTLNLIVRITQFMVALLFCCIFSMVYKQRQQAR